MGERRWRKVEVRKAGGAVKRGTYEIVSGKGGEYEEGRVGWRAQRK